MELVTNRTSGATYEYTDLNRVEGAVKQIESNFGDLGITKSFITKTDWKAPEDYSPAEWVTQKQMERYLKNIAAIKELFPNSIRIPASMENLTYTGANNIEKVLLIALQRIDGIKQTFQYSGEMYAGEE